MITFGFIMFYSASKPVFWNQGSSKFEAFEKAMACEKAIYCPIHTECIQKGCRLHLGR